MTPPIVNLTVQGEPVSKGRPRVFHGHGVTHPGCKEKETADALGIGLEYAASCWKTLNMLAQAKAKALQGRGSTRTNGDENRHEDQDFTALKAFREYMKGEA